MTATQLRAIEGGKQTKAKVARKRGKKVTGQKFSCLAIGLVALTLTGLSLDHLAHGIGIMTASHGWHSWAMAIAIDLGFICVELSQLTSDEKTRRKNARWSHGYIAGTLIGSALLNALAFATNASGWMIYPAIILGIVIPALIYALTRIGAQMYIDQR